MITKYIGVSKNGLVIKSSQEFSQKITCAPVKDILEPLHALTNVALDTQAPIYTRLYIAPTLFIMYQDANL